MIMKGKPEPEPKRRTPHQVNQVMADRYKKKKVAKSCCE